MDILQVIAWLVLFFTIVAKLVTAAAAVAVIAIILIDFIDVEIQKKNLHHISLHIFISSPLDLLLKAIFLQLIIICSPHKLYIKNSILVDG